MPPKPSGSQYRPNGGGKKGGKSGKGKPSSSAQRVTTTTRDTIPELYHNASPRDEFSSQTNLSSTTVDFPKAKSFAKAGQPSNPLRPSPWPARSNSLDSNSSTDLEDLRKQVAELEAQVGAQKQAPKLDNAPPFYSPQNSPSAVPQRKTQTTSIEMADRQGTTALAEATNARYKSSISSVASGDSDLRNELLEEPVQHIRTRGFTWVDSHRNYFSFREQVAITCTQILGAAFYLLQLEYTKVLKNRVLKSDVGGDNMTYFGENETSTSGGETFKEAAYSLHSTVLISTLMQNVLVGGVAVFNEGKEIFALHWPTFYYSLVAGAFWAVYENLTTTSVLLVGAATVALVQQTRVVFTALLRSMMLGSHITELHWHGLFLLVVSILGFHFWKLSAWHETLARVDKWTDEIGIFLCILGSIFYAFATVFTERLYREPRFSVVSFETKFLYIASRKFGFCLVYSIVMQIRTNQAFFKGWTFGVFMVCVIQIFMVVGTHFTLRRLDAVMCAISEVVSLAIVWTSQNLIYGTTFQPVALCFVLLVLQSVFIFGRVAHKANQVQDPAKSKFAGRWLHAMDAMEARATRLKTTVEPIKDQVLTRTTNMLKSVIRPTDSDE